MLTVHHTIADGRGAANLGARSTVTWGGSGASSARWVNGSSPSGAWGTASSIATPESRSQVLGPRWGKGPPRPATTPAATARPLGGRLQLAGGQGGGGEAVALVPGRLLQHEAPAPQQTS